MPQNKVKLFLLIASASGLFFAAPSRSLAAETYCSCWDTGMMERGARCWARFKNTPTYNECTDKCTKERNNVGLTYAKTIVYDEDYAYKACVDEKRYNGGHFDP